MKPSAPKIPTEEKKEGEEEDSGDDEDDGEEAKGGDAKKKKKKRSNIYQYLCESIDRKKKTGGEGGAVLNIPGVVFAKREQDNS